MDSSGNLNLNYTKRESYILETWSTKKSHSFRKFFLLFVFYSFLVLTSIFGIIYRNNIEKNKKNTLVIETKTTKAHSISKTTPSVTPTASPEPSNYGVVFKNDSYWKISKRYCGTGRYYLTIQQQNGGKSLFQGDYVNIACY